MSSLADQVRCLSLIATVVGELPLDSWSALSGHSLGKQSYRMLELVFSHLAHRRMEVDRNGLTMKMQSLLYHPSQMKAQFSRQNGLVSVSWA